MGGGSPGKRPSGTGSPGGLTGFSLSRLALVWLVGVLVLVLILTSGLVLLDENRFLTGELEGRTRTLVHLLALAAARDGDPSGVPLGGVPELRWARVEAPGGEVVWQFGVPDRAAPDAALLVVEETVTDSSGREIRVRAAASTARIRIHVLRSGLRLVLGLATALAVALLVGAMIFERVASPLKELAGKMAVFHPGDPVPGPETLRGPREVAELTRAFHQMAERLGSQRRSLVESEHRFRELFQSSPTPLLLFDGEGVLERANPAAAPYVGRGGGDPVRLGDLVEGAGGLSLPEREGGESVLERNWRLPGGGLARVELRRRAPAGGRQEWESRSGDRTLQCTLTAAAGGEHRILVVRDVTDELEAQERLRQAQKMEAVATLAGGVAHDFNNLLTGVLLHVRLLERGRGDAETLAAIRRLAEEGIEVVGELLLFARRESTPVRRVDLAGLVRSQEPLLRNLLPEGIRLTVVTPDEEVPVEASPVGLRRALFNLVLNARDAVEPPSGRISVAVERTPGWAVLRVRDTGSGIPSDVRQRLFEPFWSQRREGRGAGLGLAVVYAVVQQHGGTSSWTRLPARGPA